MWIPLNTVRAGDPCPSECGGRLYPLRNPGVVIRVTSNALATVYRYLLQRWRCNCCGDVNIITIS